MSLSGPDALRALDEAIRDIRREEDEIAKRAARGVEVTIRLQTQRAALYRQLGALRLQPDEQTAQSALLGDVAATAEAAMARYGAAVAEAEAGLQQIEASLARASADRTALQAEAGKRDAELTALAAKARPGLGNDAGYAGKLSAARTLAAIADRAERKAAQAEADREHNGRPFRDDELFMYLWTRGYGTDTYRGKGLTAWLDGRLAGYIGYDRARTNFGLIAELPTRLRRHAEAMQANAREARADIATFESVALDSAGGRAAREALEALAERIETLDRENVALQDRRDEAIRVRAALALGRHPDIAAALEGLMRMLDSEALRRLVAESRAAPDGGDDSVTGQIDDLGQRLKEEADESQEDAVRLGTLAARRRDLEDIQYELKARGFDSVHARFEATALVGEDLNALLRGETTAAAYWDRWRKGVSWTVPGYGGPGGGWGRLPGGASGVALTRPRPRALLERGLTSAA